MVLDTFYKLIIVLYNKKMEKFVVSIKVTNDTSERGIKLLKDFKDVLTEDSEQQNIVMHCVENIQKYFPILRNRLLVHFLQSSACLGGKNRQNMIIYCENIPINNEKSPYIRMTSFMT